MFFLSSAVSNFVIWWRVFLIMTLVFLYLNKSFCCFSRRINYFIVQEFIGLLFLLFNFTLIQFIIVVFKVGIAPFHFWIFSVLNNTNIYMTLWFLTFQKLPFIPVLFYFMDFFSFYLFLLGIIFCYFQIFLSKSYKSILIISSTESFNWLLIIMFFSLYSSLLFLFLYFFFLFLVLGYSTKKNLDFFSWELVFVFINIPIGILFFIKIFSLVSGFMFSSIVFLFLLFFMFLSVLSFSFWILNTRTKFYFFGINSNLTWVFLFLPLFFFCLIYSFSLLKI